MHEEIDLTIKSQYINDYKEGYPLITKESVVDWEKVTKEGVIINLLDDKKSLSPKGIMGYKIKVMAGFFQL